MTTLVAERVTEKRVMVVEDESIISLDIRNSLKKLGYGIAGAAASGDVALMKIANSRPDLILMDIHLKGKMTGIQVSQQVQSNFQIPVIYLTANADSATFNGAKETSPYGYLLKPFEEKELGMAIEIALYKHEQKQIVRSSESWYAIAFQPITDAVIATDVNGYIVFMNAAAESATGWQLTDVMDKPLTEVITFQRKIQQFDNIKLKESVRSILNATLRGKSAIPFPHHAHLLTKSLDALSLVGDATAIRDATGRVTGSIFVFRDAQAPLTVEPSSVERDPANTFAECAEAGDKPRDESTDEATDETFSLSLQEEQTLKEGLGLISAFTKAFIDERPIARSTVNLVASSGDGLTTLSSREEGMVVKVTMVNEKLTAIVKQSSKFWALIRHVLVEHSFFPISRRTNGHCYYQHRHVPDNCQIYHTGGTELWEAWHDRVRPGGPGQLNCCPKAAKNQHYRVAPRKLVPHSKDGSQRGRTAYQDGRWRNVYYTRRLVGMGRGVQNGCLQ
ncbi:MAG: response regulator [Cyanobacteria bacterium J06621_3]